MLATQIERRVYRASALFQEVQFVAICQGAQEARQARLPRSWRSLRPVIQVEDRACRRIIPDPACP